MYRTNPLPKLDLLDKISEEEIYDTYRDGIMHSRSITEEYRQYWLWSLDQFISGANTEDFLLSVNAKHPVNMEQFLFDTAFLGRPRDSIYPAVLEELIKINNAGGFRFSNPYTEAVFTGSIGSAKTSTALYTIAYQLYILSCFRNPHKTFNLDSTSEILFIFQSIKGGLAKSVDYGRFREICNQSTYFRSVFPFDPSLESYLKFPSRIEVRPISSDGGTIGQNVIGGMIDEVNYMAVTEKSKKAIDKGVYNQALVIYDSISRRRKTRFLSAGKMPGILCLVSSRRYPGEFTDQKIKEAKKDKSIYVYDKRVWDIKPKGTFSKGFFRVFIGDLSRKTRILTEGEELGPGDKKLIVSVPLDFRTDFENDPIGALRDIAGVGTLARYPFLLNTDKVNACFNKTRSVFSLEETDFVTSRLHLDPAIAQDKTLPRWVHIDLGVTGDAAGVAIGYVPEFKSVIVRLQGSDGELGRESEEKMPVIKFDGLLRVTPPKGDEIIFSKIRNILYLLRAAGINIRWCTFDSFQSVDSIQILRQRGFSSGKVSIDANATPYEMTKAAFYSNRLILPPHIRCQEEFLSLEKDLKSGRVDHPPDFCFVGETKLECSDGIARSMEDLVIDYQSGIVHCGVSYDLTIGEHVSLPLRHPRIERYTKDLVEVALDTGGVFKCTPNHRFLLIDGAYKEARYLSPGDELQD